MAEQVTIWRFFHKSSHALLGDGKKVSVIGWTQIESVAGVEIDALGKEENQVARVAYVFHSPTQDPALLVAPFQNALGFVPEFSECETLIRSEIVPGGAREEWFDVFDGACQPDERVYVLYPGSEKNRESLRSDSRETLYV